jgi:hypothetical protein
MHEPSVQFFWEPLETTRLIPETSTTPTCCHPIASKQQLDESLLSFQLQMGTCLRGGTYWVWGPKGQMSEYPIPHEEHFELCTLRRSYMVS